jgi:hypothetical protein
MKRLAPALVALLVVASARGGDRWTRATSLPPWLNHGAAELYATLYCGPQKPRPAAIEYGPSSDDMLGTPGVVPSIEFRS